MLRLPLLALSSLHSRISPTSTPFNIWSYPRLKHGYRGDALYFVVLSNHWETHSTTSFVKACQVPFPQIFVNALVPSLSTVLLHSGATVRAANKNRVWFKSITNMATRLRLVSLCADDDNYFRVSLLEEILQTTGSFSRIDSHVGCILLSQTTPLGHRAAIWKKNQSYYNCSQDENHMYPTPPWGPNPSYTPGLRFVAFDRVYTYWKDWL